jgi:3,4-dihydroxy 2-butanone 4-phosphate synthase / GTP cyclohydrolase II
VFGADSAVDRVVERLARSQCGVMVYLREGSVGVARAAGRPRDGVTGDERHGSAALRDAEWREIGLGAQILRDLGVTSIRLLASRERRYVGLDGFGIAIEATEIIDH